MLKNESTEIYLDLFPFLFPSQQVHSAVEEMDGLDDVENSMLYYNQAVILYHLRQYTEAIIIGEKLYQFIEPFGKIITTEEVCLFIHSFSLYDYCSSSFTDILETVITIDKCNLFRIITVI